MSLVEVFLFGVVTVCLLVLLPLLFEFVLNALQAFGFKPWRSLHITNIMSRLLSLSDKAEYGVMVLVLFFILLPIYFHFFDVMPFFLFHYPADSLLPLPVYLLLFHWLPSAFLNGNMLFHFWKIITVPPGMMADKGRFQALSDTKIAAASQALASSGESRWCNECERPKAPRAHHCYTCGGCVLRHDHHCVFAANCIGLNNSHHFFLFIMYCALSGVYAIYVAQRPYFDCAVYDLSSKADTDDSLERLCRQHSHHSALLYLSLFSAAILATFFVIVFHVTITGQTLHEFLKQAVWQRHIRHIETDVENQPVEMRELSKTPSKGDDGLGAVRGFSGDAVFEKVEKRHRVWRNNLEGQFGPVWSWWRWLLPFPQLHRTPRKTK